MSKSKRSKSLAGKTQTAHQRRFEAGTNFELCWDLAGRFAKRSASRVGDDIGTSRFSYNEIACGFRALRPIHAATKIALRRRKSLALRKVVASAGSHEALVEYLRSTRPVGFQPSLSEQLRPAYQTDADLNRLISDIESSVRSHLRQLNSGDRGKPHELSQLSGHNFDNTLLRVVANEWLRDAKTLRQFLIEMFRRWRKIDHPQSTWRRRMVEDQMSSKFGHDVASHREHLEKISSISAKHSSSHQLIKQDFSRDLQKHSATRKANCAVTKIRSRRIKTSPHKTRTKR